MKQETVQLNYLRIAPRKVRLVAKLIKGMSVNEAEAQLLNWSQRSTGPLIKLIRSAVANAVHNKKLNKDKLVIAEIQVGQGPTLKRFLPRAQGRATPIHKKSSHITLTIKEVESLKAPRFTIIAKQPTAKKDKKEEKVKKTTMQKPETTAKETAQSKEGGFMKRIFNRKSI